MSALDRVQSFLKSRAGRTALTVIPLAAAVAVSAQAVPLSFANSGSAYFTSSTGMTLTVPYTVNPATQALSEWEGITGIKGWGSVVGTAPVGASANRSIYFNMQGEVTGGPFGPGQTVPLMWDFALGTTDTANQVSYRILLTLHNGTNYVDVYDSGVLHAGLGGGAVSGHGHTIDLAGFSPALENFWSLQLQAYINGMTGGATLSLDIPSSSIDINADPAVPEPGTWFLMAGGTALLLFGRRLRKR
jgi:hypothetical protein